MFKMQPLDIDAARSRNFVLSRFMVEASGVEGITGR
jgi:hypothetical protein